MIEQVSWDAFGNKINTIKYEYPDNNSQFQISHNSVYYAGYTSFDYYYSLPQSGLYHKQPSNGGPLFGFNSYFYPPKYPPTTCTTTVYQNNVVKLSTIKNYTYDSNWDIISETWQQSDNSDHMYQYEKDYEYLPINRVNNISTIPDFKLLYKTTLWKTQNSNKSLIGLNQAVITPFICDDKIPWVTTVAGTYPTHPKFFQGMRVDKQISLVTDHPLSLSEYTGYYFSTYLNTDINCISRDAANNVTETKYNGLTYSASIWNTIIGKKIAEITNAHYNDVAYTSFEGTFTPKGTFDDNKGNWDFDPGNILTSTLGNTTKSITGRYEYHMSYSGGSMVVPNNIVSRNNLTAGKTYILSFWCSAPPNVIETTTTLASASISVNWVRTVNSWNLYTATFTSIGGKIDISNPGSNVIRLDELRLYPVESSIATTTYEPLFGPSSQCDNLNNIIYYEYDVMGRLKVTRDIDNNIISLQKTRISDPDN